MGKVYGSVALLKSAKPTLSKTRPLGDSVVMLTALYKYTWNPVDNPFKVDGNGDFPSISYIKIWFIIQIETRIL